MEGAPKARPTHYDTLGVSRTATTEEIKEAYWAKSKEYHPNAPGGGDEEKFKKLSQAYSHLKDEEHRRKYEETLSTHPSSSSDSHPRHYWEGSTHPDARRYWEGVRGTNDSTDDPFLDELVKMGRDSRQRMLSPKILEASREKVLPVKFPQAWYVVVNGRIRDEYYDAIERRGQLLIGRGHDIGECLIDQKTGKPIVAGRSIQPLGAYALGQNFSGKYVILNPETGEGISPLYDAIVERDGKFFGKRKGVEIELQLSTKA